MNFEILLKNFVSAQIYVFWLDVYVNTVFNFWTFPLTVSPAFYSSLFDSKF